MSRRPAAFALAGVALFLALSTVLPLATADHAYSHRYIIFGRLVDANGNPVPSVTLNMDISDPLLAVESSCRATGTGSDLSTDAYGPTASDPLTDTLGDFIFCFHGHSMRRNTPGEVRIAIPAMPEVPAITLTLDPLFRTQFLLFTLPTVSAEARADTVEGNYTVIGRFWRESAGKEESVEGIPVYGDTLTRLPVLIELVDPAGAVIANRTTTTNDYGDFAVRVPTASRFVDGVVRITGGNRTFTAPAAREGVTHFKAEMAPAESQVLQNILIIGGAIVAGVAIVGGAYWGVQRMSQRRELEAIRESTHRKRANK